MLPVKFEKGDANFIDLQDILNVSQDKLQFIRNFFTLQPIDREPEICKEAASGMASILESIEEEIEVVVDELEAMKDRAFAAKDIKK
jgi:hypothetical protein